MSLVYPHPVLTGELGLSAGGLLLDGEKPAKDVVDSSIQTVSLFRLQERGWERCALEAEIEHQPEDLEAARASFGNFTVSLVAFCRSSNARRSVRVSLGPSGRTSCQVELDRSCFRGKVELYAVLSGEAEDGVPRWLGQSDAWRLYFDEPDVLPIEGMLRVKWADFDDKEDQRIPDGARSESFFAAVEEQPPLIYLNSAFEGLPELLSDDQSRPPPEKALRDAEYRRIASAAWSEMFWAAVASVDEGDDGSPIWPAEDWKRQVLDALIPQLYPDSSSASEGLAELWGELNEGVPQLGGLLQVAISEQINASKSLKADIKRVDS